MLVFLLANILTSVAYAQSSTISGKIINRTTNESISAVSVTIKGSQIGTFTDDKGNFKVTFNQKLPVTMLFSSVGYALQELVITNPAEYLTIQMAPSNSLGQEVVVSATKVAQKILESPVSIERVSAANIRNSPVSSY